ncbi:AAA family ATPase [Clostridioides difficile]|uniref:ATP-dependent nuclease n=1 Tax=Clostridioides difficile TaxID=1496 RepID=UPI000BB1EE88|nr:AAA family ATPase [Clostridioides difficile]MDN4809413.1 AAA family ATPase [Clostridioides difficile]PBD81412.1 ATP-dependent endonuclease [Clostridioides difficile]HBH1341651.1 AAA family ATPase [Clostridioides difficile]
MSIRKLKIKNFKCFSDWFTVDFENGINILVGNNGTGKSTILEAINLVLTGTYHGKNIRNELTQYLFNKNIVENYIREVNEGVNVEPPKIIIEAYFDAEMPSFLGDGNSEKTKDTPGICLSISFDEKYSNEYKMLCKNKITSLPIEYYEVSWMSFARENITARSIPIKSAMIDTTSYTPTSGSDIYISRIVKNLLDDNEIINISQAHRLMKEQFSRDENIANINRKLTETSNNELTISVDFGTKTSWESSLVTQLNEIPYNNIGKGTQCIVKTQLALSDHKIENKQIVLLEEPECHLSYSNLNILLDKVNESVKEKQIIVTTHSSFVSNKLGLENLILLNRGKTLRLGDLSNETNLFFKRIAGYDTLRLLLSNKAILVEGDSDELIVQRAYMDSHNGKLPINDGIDIISVGISFLRFLEIAKLLELRVSVITNNDGNIDALNRKYSDYLGDNCCENINIYFDDSTHEYNGSLENYNYNTLEPCIYRSNSMSILNEILNKSYEDPDDLLKYMKGHKTEVALKIFESDKAIEFPQYIKEGILI